MGLFDIFRRKPPVTDAASLADFIDANGAFVAQKGLFEYSRARAGHYAKVLFNEKPFIEALERARWQAFPIGLAMVTEVAESVLHPSIVHDRRAALDALTALVLDVFDRYPVPEQLGAPAWREQRVALARRLDLIGLHPPKPAKDIPTTYADAYIALMPIHEKLRGSDTPTLRNYLRATICNIHDELARRIDAAAVARVLLESRAPAIAR
jgi:hypothetical protein